MLRNAGDAVQECIGRAQGLGHACSQLWLLPTDMANCMHQFKYRMKLIATAVGMVSCSYTSFLCSRQANVAGVCIWWGWKQVRYRQC